MTLDHGGTPWGGTMERYAPRPGHVGTLVGVPSPQQVEMVSSLGFDFLFLDLEHGLIAAHDLSIYCMASQIPVMARLSEPSERSINTACDAGVAAIVLPHVASAALAQEAVDCATYPPSGRRSVGLGRNSLLGVELAEALASAKGPSVIAQIEDAVAVDVIEEIVAVDGLVSVFIGPFDLSASLGVLGDTDSSTFTEAVRRVTAAASGAAMPVGIFAPTPAAWVDAQGLGVDYAVLRSDSLFLADGARAALNAVKESSGK